MGKSPKPDPEKSQQATSADAAPERLHEDEVDDVVELALRRQTQEQQAKDETVSDATLTSVASELGLSPEALLQAKAEFLQRKKFKRKIGLVLGGIALITGLIAVPMWRKQHAPAAPPAPTPRESSGNAMRVQELREEGGRLRKLKEWSAAVKAYEKALALAPDHVSIHNEIGIAYQNSEMPDEAEKHYRRSIELAKETPDAYFAYYNLGTMFDDGPRTAEAIAAYQAAIKLKPEDPDAYSKLGLVYLRLKQKDAARRAFDDALQRNPSHEEAKQGLASVLPHAIRGEPTDADKATAERLRNDAMKHRNAKRYDEAIRTYQQALKLHPKNFNIIDELGLAYQDDKQYAEAEKCYRQAMAQAGKHPDAYYATFHLAFLFDDTYKRHHEAMPYYRQALQLKPEKGLAHNNMGWIYLQENNFDAAQQEFLAALEVEPALRNAQNGLRALAKKRKTASSSH